MRRLMVVCLLGALTLPAMPTLALADASSKGGGEALMPELSQREAQQQAFGKDADFREIKRDDVAQRAKNASQRFDEYINAYRLKLWDVRVNGAQVGWFATDEVIGKVEKIDFAVAFDISGNVRQVFILKYRESHGQEIKRPSWLSQFPGKNASNALKLNKDIDNITGATLSCDHLTDGIRKISRVLAPAP